MTLQITNQLSSIFWWNVSQFKVLCGIFTCAFSLCIIEHSTLVIILKTLCNNSFSPCKNSIEWYMLLNRPNLALIFFCITFKNIYDLCPLIPIIKLLLLSECPSYKINLYFHPFHLIWSSKRLFALRSGSYYTSEEEPI